GPEGRGRGGPRAARPAHVPPGPARRPPVVKRPLRSEELRLWRAIAATVHPLPGRAAPPPPPEAAPPPSPASAKVAEPAARVPIPASKPKALRPAGPAPLERIEPGRLRRISRERDPIG